MDTLFQDLRSALQALSGYPAFTLAAAMSLGLSLRTAHLPPARAVRAVRIVAPPHRTLSWMDYIDFRRGSGDVLRWISPTSPSEQAAPPDHPHSCGTRG